jgi:hypothetical protein
MATTSAVWPLHVALAAAILADPTVAALLSGEKVYSLVAPRAASFDYVVLGATAAQDLPTFTRAGEQGSILLHVWCAGDDQMTTLQLFGELRRVLHNVRLPLTGTTQVHCLGQLSLVSTSEDPSGDFAHGVLRYSFWTL